MNIQIRMHLRKALIAMGWTPPPDITKHYWKCISPGMYDSTYECTKCGRKFTDQADAGITVDDCPFPCTDSS